MLDGFHWHYPCVKFRYNRSVGAQVHRSVTALHKDWRTDGRTA